MPTDLNTPTKLRPSPSRAVVIGFWVFTALFCLEMSFTAYYELTVLPQAAQAFSRLGFPAAYFRVELSWAKVVGVLALLLPMVPPRLKEWAYAGFAINLASALVAHFSISDRPLAFIPSSLTAILWAASYLLWRRLETADLAAKTDPVVTRSPSSHLLPS